MKASPGRRQGPVRVFSEGGRRNAVCHAEKNCTSKSIQKIWAILFDDAARTALFPDQQLSAHAGYHSGFQKGQLAAWYLWKQMEWAEELYLSPVVWTVGNNCAKHGLVQSGIYCDRHSPGDCSSDSFERVNVVLGFLPIGLIEFDGELEV